LAEFLAKDGFKTIFLCTKITAKIGRKKSEAELILILQIVHNNKKILQKRDFVKSRF